MKVWLMQASEFLGDFQEGLNIGLRENGKTSVVTNIELETIDEHGATPIKPAIQGPEVVSFLQAAMDAGYEMGLRPSRANDETALKNHLKDMQEISRHLLKMDKKP